MRNNVKIRFYSPSVSQKSHTGSSQHYKPCHRYGCLKVGENSWLWEILNRLIYPQPQARMTCQVIPSVANECGVIPICKLHNNCERDRTKLYHTCIWQTSKTSISMPNNHHKDNYIKYVKIIIKTIMHKICQAYSTISIKPQKSWCNYHVLWQ